MELATAARAAGLAEDQFRRFVRAKYSPLPQMLDFHAAARMADRADGPDQVGLGGTRGPGKSHAALAQVGIDDCQRIPGLKFLYLRKVQKSAAESLEDLVYKVFANTPMEYVPSRGRIVFPNGSRILLGGYRNDSDIDKYLGIEYDGAVIEESTQLSTQKHLKIGGSIRTSRTDWRPRIYHTTNPDGVGLQYFKRLFVLPWRAGQERESRTRFIPVSYKANPYLNEGYVRFLEGLTGPLASAWRDADWDAFEGQAFPEWKYETHVVQPFKLPNNSLRWRAVDWGYAAPWCCLWLAKVPDSGRVYVYREAYETQLTDTQQAQRIIDLTAADERIAYTLADPNSYWEQKSDMEGKIYTPADVYAQVGVGLEKADNHRLDGKRRIHEALALRPDGLPGVQVFSNCFNLIEQMGTLIFDPVHVEDVDTDQEDHAYDTFRYGLTSYGGKTRDKERDRKREQAKQDYKRLREIL